MCIPKYFFRSSQIFLILAKPCAVSLFFAALTSFLRPISLLQCPFQTDYEVCFQLETLFSWQIIFFFWLSPLQLLRRMHEQERQTRTRKVVISIDSYHHLGWSEQRKKYAKTYQETNSEEIFVFISSKAQNISCSFREQSNHEIRYAPPREQRKKFFIGIENVNANFTGSFWNNEVYCISN